MSGNNTIYYPEVIPDTPLPNSDPSISTAATQSVSGDIYGQAVIQDQSLPTRYVAIDTIGESLNTKSKKILAEFQFVQQGAIQIGTYQNGISGDIRIAPTGLVARNSAGNTTIAIDGDTGNATFAGTIQAGAVIAGEVIVGNNTLILDGLNSRILVNDLTYDRVLIGQF